MKRVSYERGRQFEEFCALWLHSFLSERLHGRTVSVSPEIELRSKIQGSCGIVYEFDIAAFVDSCNGTSHKLLAACECKDHSMCVNMDMMAGFAYKIHDAEVPVGIFFSAEGFEKGALNIASQEGIYAICLKNEFLRWIRKD